MNIIYSDSSLELVERPFDIATLAAFLGKLREDNTHSYIMIEYNTLLIAKIIQSPFDAAECICMTRNNGAKNIPFNRPHIIYNHLMEKQSYGASHV